MDLGAWKVECGREFHLRDWLTNVLSEIFSCVY